MARQESMYAKYKQERNPRARVLEWEGEGFASYIIDNEECFIDEIYVVPEKRKTGMAEGMADEIAVLAKEKGCTILTGSVCVGARGDTESLRILLAYGMVLDSVRGNMIVFKKDLGGYDG